ncbi:MAG: cupin domain-containing protein [Pseudomonadota bacterium]
MPKVKLSAWEERDRGPHPVTGQNDGPSAEISLGDLVGLSQFGARLKRLPPGSRTSHRHWHETEDEFVFVVSGELVLVEDTETVLIAGDAAGWQAGQPIGHCIENRSVHEAVLLVVGTRVNSRTIHYPDHDMIYRRSETGESLTRSDGSPIAM